MKCKALTSIISIVFIGTLAYHLIVLAAIDAPHNESYSVSCGTCHGQGLLDSPFWGGSMSYDMLCTNCHKVSSCPYVDTNVLAVVTHLDADENALAECRTCHDPHYQKQKNYKNTDWNNLYLAYGTIESFLYNDVDGTSTLTYDPLSIVYKAGWDATRLLGKTDTCRRTILFPNIKKLGYSYPIIAVDTPSINTITVKGDVTPVYQYITESDFAVLYGQFIRDSINGSQVKFFDQTGTDSYADGNTIYNGVCEVCHTLTDHFRNDGSGGDQNHANVGGADGTNCISCHKHVDGFGHSTGTGTGCEACHGQDGGAGTTQSHSTHTENDSDDLKGPNIPCSDCHDTNNYPNFAGHYYRTYYKEITIQSSKVEADLTNFPMLFKTVDPDLKTTANGGHVTNANGYDIVFTDSNGNQLDHEIEKYDCTTGELVAWVRIPNLSSTTDIVIRIGYNNNTITSSQENITGVWDTNYKAVWHLDEGDSTAVGFYKDSTSNNNHATLHDNDGDSSAVTGRINGGMDLEANNSDGDNSDDFIELHSTDLTDGWNAITLSAWINADALSDWDSIVGHWSDVANTNCALTETTAADSTVRFQIRTDASTLAIAAAPNGSIGTGSWYYLVGTWQANNSVKIYVNSSVTSGGVLAGPIIQDGWFVMGSGITVDRKFNGKIDEVRVSNTARSAEWIKTSYNNQNSPSTFYTVGAEQDTGPVDLAGTTACDDCHSSGGAYNGVAMAKANWEDGVYELDGTLKSGNEQWCATCHDNIPANSKKDGTGIFAPKVVGNNSTWGFYATGHGANGLVECLDCHDASKTHIDGNPRTYEVTGDGAGPPTVVNPYTPSYRLKKVNGGPALNIPRPLYPIHTHPLTYASDFALCFYCHNRYEVVGDQWDVSKTNFWDDDGDPDNSHFHLNIYSYHADTDWDGAPDSSESCITCHNVHGPPNRAMIRHGELINKVPALNFSYLVPGTGPFATATWTPNIPTAGNYYVYAWWSEWPNRATNARYTVNYDGGSATHQVNQRINGGQWNQLGTGTYPFLAGTSGNVVLSNEGANGQVIADAIGLDSDGVFGVDPEIVIDNPSATFVGTWSFAVEADQYGTNVRFHDKPPYIIDPSATLEQSVGARMSLVGPGVPDNGVCGACHNALSYERTPFLGPKVLRPEATPDTVPNDGSGSTLITAMVFDPTGDFSTMRVNLTSIGGSASQQMYDDGTNGDVAPEDGIYSYLATIVAGTSDVLKSLVITAIDGAANSGQSTTKILVFDPDSIYMDDPEATFVGTWGWAADADKYGDYIRFNDAGTGTETATWTPNISSAGDYKVYAWWAASPNRATNAPYTIYYDGGSDEVRVNQEVNGGKWNLLGTYPFAAGTSGYVVLSDDANEYVVADAIKFEPVP